MPRLTTSNGLGLKNQRGLYAGYGSGLSLILGDARAVQYTYNVGHPDFPIGGLLHMNPNGMCGFGLTFGEGGGLSRSSSNTDIYFPFR